jgi:UDP-glucose 4-epimerase
MGIRNEQLEKNKMNILVTGGAGYIGSAAVAELIKANHKVIVIDNLSNSSQKFVSKKAKFCELDLTDEPKLEEVFKEHKIEAVIHFAAYKAVDESMENAVKYSDNIYGTINLLNLMVKYKVPKIVFSSSAAVYGMPKEGKVDEKTQENPINYYGFTKLMCEKVIDWYSRIHGIRYVSLRYFNVAGDAGLKYIDKDAKNIFPILMEVISGKRDKLIIYGKDYDTRDGTCVRDYIDLNDLVEAHVLAIDAEGSHIINLGTSLGVTVKELVEATEQVTGNKIPHEYGERRKGDPPILIASNSKAKDILRWEPKRTIKEMIESTLEAYSIDYQN